MPSINSSAGQADVSITKQPDGTITFSAPNWPGASFGPNNETVSGHCGGVLDVNSIHQSIQSDEQRIEDKRRFIDDAFKQINNTTRNPPYDPAYIDNLKSQVAGAQNDIQIIKDSLDSWNSLDKQYSTLVDQVNAADKADVPAGEAQTNEEKNAAEAQGVTKEPGTATSDQTESVTTKDPTEFQGESGSSPPTTAEGSTPDGAGQEQNNDGGGGDKPSGNFISKIATGRVDGPPSNRASAATATWSGEKQDMRIMLKIPPGYLSGPHMAPEIKAAGGIVFPYTPNISYDTAASYGSSNPLHSNYTQYFFKNSAVSAISITGKFTVQNENEANIWLSIVHLGRALTKMPFGNDTKFLAGSAPPVLRLHGYGTHIFDNVPVAITSFKFDLPEGVDYIYNSSTGFTDAMAPVISTFTFSLIPMYSRKEIREFSIDKWISGDLPKGYL
jgi:hypothetical protein